MAQIVPPAGPKSARIMIVGEAPGADEDTLGTPFTGVSGGELCKMLNEAGIRGGSTFWSSKLNKYAVDWSTSECRVTNVVLHRPPDNDVSIHLWEKKSNIPKDFRPFRDKHVSPTFLEGLYMLQAEIAETRPNIILAFGNVALWTLTGQWAVTKWRGSMLECDIPCKDDRLKIKLIPSIHPAAVLREWSFRSAVVTDLKRVARYRDSPGPFVRPDWKFHVAPDFNLCCSLLQRLLDRLESGEYLKLSFDIETGSGHISCAGIAWSRTEAMCIPFVSRSRPQGYWNADQEGELVFLLYRVLTHPRAQVIGQNLLYDCQYEYRHHLFIPRVAQDTMISQHSIFSDQPKALAYQASVYCQYYRYWKDEGKELNDGEGSEETLWYYNCEDTVYTYECAEVELAWAKQLGLEAVHQAQQEMFYPVLRTMIRGVRIDHERRAQLILEVQEQIAAREQTLIDLLGHPINPRSSQQMIKLFYTDLNQIPIMTRAKKGKPGHVTCDDEALQKLAQREPLLRPIINCISDIRTLGIFLSHFLCKPLDTDGRMRCSYNIGGSESGKSAPKTYRLSSSENAFGSGANLQAIPSAKSKSVGKAKARGSFDQIGQAIHLPNLRSMFCPDPGYTFFDMDLDRADLQVVAWEAEDEQLKHILRIGADMHLVNAFVVQGKEPPPLEECVKTHPKYLDHLGPQELVREFAKVFCHATNYVGGSRTVAAHTGRTVHEIDRAQAIWFGAHPGIRTWHRRVDDQVQRRRYVENKFGYRWYIFDRLDNILAEAVAWIPQSTVSLVINKIWKAFDQIPSVEVLLQVHDMLGFQVPTGMVQSVLPELREKAKIIVPYDDPLIIPASFKMSEKSWGDCE